MRQVLIAGLLLSLLTPGSLAARTVTPPASVPATKNGKAFLASATVQRRLTQLIGRGNFELLSSDFKQVGNLQNDARITAFIGCEEGGCGINDALVIYARDTDTFRVLLHRDERPTQFQERGKISGSQYNMALKSAIINFGL